MKNNPDTHRRAVLKGLLGIPVVALTGFQTSAQAAMLSVDDPTAKALAYTEKSTTAGHSCSTCSLFSGGSAAAGPCAIFPGKEVAATGWCKSWVARP